MERSVSPSTEETDLLARSTKKMKRGSTSTSQQQDETTFMVEDNDTTPLTA